MYYQDPRYTTRSAEWGHWGITLMDAQPDKTKNFGVIVGFIGFAVGAGGPCDGTIGSPLRRSLQQRVDDWIDLGIMDAAARAQRFV